MDQAPKGVPLSSLTREQKIQMLTQGAAAPSAAPTPSSTPGSIPSVSELTREQKIQMLTGGAQSPSAANVVDESADLSGRFAVKNFGGSIADSIAYLQGKNPDHDITEIGGEIVARPKNSTGPYKKLDPSSLEFADITDMAYDIPSAILTGIGTGAAGAAGAAAGGIGALPAAMAGGAATSGGLELLRQGIGNTIGVQKGGANGEDLAMATGLGAASPFLFGTGATAGQIARAAGKGLAADALPAAAQVAKMESAQSGLPGRAIKNILSSSMSGVPRESIDYVQKPVSSAIKEMIGDLPKDATGMDVVNKLQKTGSGELIDKLTNKVQKDGYGIVKRLEGEVADGLSKVQDKIPVQQYEDLLTQMAAESGSLQNAEAKATQASIEELRDSLFKMDKKELPATDFMKLKNQMRERAGLYGQNVVTPASTAQEQAAKTVLGKMSDDLYAAVDKASPIVGEDAKGVTIRKKYADTQTLLRDILPNFKTGKKSEATLKKFQLGSDADGNVIDSRWLAGRLNEFQKNYGTPIGDVAAALHAQKFFGNPSWLSLSGQGSPATAKILTGAGLGAIAGGALGNKVDSGSGGYIGTGAGMLAGSAAFSPAMLKAALQASLKTKALREGVNTYGKYAAPGFTGGQLPSAWMYMNNRGER